ncbi:MAG: hypothetical protein MJZ34_15220 [Paludibacteraceae bacterium]|nr:hypothetical protein [Paludibacteraceae bacterium]
MDVTVINCPNCGAPVSSHAEKCEYCAAEVLIKSFKKVRKTPSSEINKYINNYLSSVPNNPNNCDLNVSIGLCWLRIQKYDNAITSFEKAQENNMGNHLPYFYAAIARLKGRKPFLCNKQEIGQMETELNAAVDISSDCLSYYFLACIGKDYYKRKFLKHDPSYEYYLDSAYENGLTEELESEFFEMTNFTF